MKKIFTDWEYLSLRILILGLTVCVWSYPVEIPGFTQGILGDTLTYDEYLERDEIHWGFRHHVYNIVCGLLTIVQIIKTIKWIDQRSECQDSFPVKKCPRKDTSNDED